MESHRKPGPRKQYGERQDVRLLLPVELMDYIDSVTSNRTKWLIEAAQEKRQREEERKMEATATFSATLEKFLESDDFKKGLIASTRASWGGSGYSVELFPDGHWNVLWNNQIGNLYTSPGVIISLPSFDDSDYQAMVNAEENPIDEEEFFRLCFDAESEELAQSMRDALAD